MTPASPLADACALLAFFAGAGPGADGLAALRAGRTLVSAVTVWELTRKAALGKLPPLPQVAGSFAGYLQAEGFVPLPLTWQDAEAANALPPIHKDPMDRMLIAQALRQDLPVITSDALFVGYGVTTIW